MMQKIHFRLTSVAQKRCCLSSLTMGKKQWAQKVVPLTCEKWSFTRGSIKFLSFKRKILEFRTEGSLWKLYWKLYRSTQLSRRKSTGRDSRCCAKEKMSHSFDKYDNNIPTPDHLDVLLCHLQSFLKDQKKKCRGDFEPNTETPASHWRINTYSALSFDGINLKICL